jgi:hypothetical protein
MAVPKNTHNLECTAEYGSQPPAYASVCFLAPSVFKLHGEELLR